jgi:cardiolipin synthase (CMP-forming)
MKIKTIKRINVSIALFFIWIFCIFIYYLFLHFAKITFNYSILVLSSETLLCFIIWLFFMIKIDWLRETKTGNEIMYLNISNVLSATRFSLVPLLIGMFGLLTLSEGQYTLRIIIFIFAVLVSLTDFFDGILARKLNQVTNIGRIIDPFGDFLLIISFSVLLFLQKILTYWYFVLLMIRIPGLVIVAVFLMILNIKFKVKTTILGKITIFYTLCLLGLGTIKLLLDFDNYYYNSTLFILQIIGAVILALSSFEKIKLLVYYLKNQNKIATISVVDN